MKVKPLWQLLIADHPSILRVLNQKQRHDLERQMQADQKKISCGMTKPAKATNPKTK